MMKRDKLDVVFSNLVRERANYICEVCGNNYRYRTQGLHCSHLWGRRNRSTRWHPENAAAKCFGCHKKLSERPVEFGEWIEKHLGKRFNFVRRAANTPIKFTKLERDDMCRFYTKELARLQALRKEGIEGRIEFKTPPILDLKLREVAARL